MKKCLDSFLVHGKSKYLESLLKRGDYEDLRQIREALRNHPGRVKPEHTKLLEERLLMFYYKNLALAC